MNERIKELALEAFQPINDIASEGIADRHTFNQAWFQLYNQKFAELIVQECSKINDEHIGRRIGEIDLDLVYKEHFGIKDV